MTMAPKARSIVAGDVALVARDDELGRRLQDLDLPQPRARRSSP